VGSGNPSTLALGIADQQPAIAGVLNQNFFSRLYPKLARRIILEHERLFSFAREQFDGDPALTAIVRLAPPPSGESLVLLSDHNALTRGNAYRVGILHLVLPPDPDFIVRFFHERYPAASN